jgi:hypothetical protein
MERRYSVKSNGKRTARLSLLGLTGVVNDRLVVLVRAMREVHADHVQTGCFLVGGVRGVSTLEHIEVLFGLTSSEHVDGLGRVCLGANGADD